MLNRNCSGNNSEDSYICYSDGEYKDYLITIKRGLGDYTRESMIAKCDEYVEMAKELLHLTYPDYTYEIVNIDDKVNAFIEKCVLEEMRNKI